MTIICTPKCFESDAMKNTKIELVLFVLNEDYRIKKRGDLA